MPAGVVRPPAVAQAHGSGWITYASWINDTGTPVSSFATTWVVPPAPATQSDQTLFLFNGIQSSAWIVQPVLQWGKAFHGAGGNYWAVASWYADGPGGPAFPSGLVAVNPGDVLIGVITLTARSAKGFTYKCEFEGIPQSSIVIQNEGELTWLAETLECYGITRCSDYPATQDTKMTGINVKAGEFSPSLVWTPTDAVSECGQHTVVVSNSSTSGEVDLWYRGATGIALTGGLGWSTIPVARSDGDGTFGVSNLPAPDFAVRAQQRDAQVLTGDFDGDGRTDLALTGGSGWAGIPVASSQGDGSFQVTDLAPVQGVLGWLWPADFPGWAQQRDVQVLTGDFDGDGRTDIALAGGSGWASIPVAFSSGNGAFTVTNLPATDFAGWAQERNVQVLTGDFNGDGRTDIALTRGLGWVSIPVAFSNGDGAFTVTNLPVADFAGWAQERDVRVFTGDFDGDGRTDIALIGGAGWSTIAVAFSSGDGTFTVTNLPVADFAGWAAQPDVVGHLVSLFPPSSSTSALTHVPDVRNFSVGPAEQKVSDAFLIPFPLYPRTRPPNASYWVEGQFPNPGTAVAVGTIVTLRLSAGQPL
jgi:hypothetical protein